MTHRIELNEQTIRWAHETIDSALRRAKNGDRIDSDIILTLILDDLNAEPED